MKIIWVFFVIIFLSSCGGSGSDGSKNTAPSLVGIMDYAVDENTSFVGTFSATDPDNDPIVYSLSGDDAALFSIGLASGELSFVVPPDFENPSDHDADNIYALTVTAFDGLLGSSLGIIVTVNDVFDTPPSVSLSINVSTISVFNQATLSWTSQDADACNADKDWQGDKELTGSEQLYFSTPGDRVFKIECTNPFGSSEDAAGLSVSDIVIKEVPDKISLFNEG